MQIRPFPEPRRKPLAACLALALSALAGSLPLAASVAAVDRAASMPRASRIDAEHSARQRADIREYRRALRGVAPPRAQSHITPQGSPLHVTNCADDGSTGSLRDVVAAAPSGATVDLSQLACSTITLVSGDIEVRVDDLTLRGPGQDKLTIDAGHGGRAFYHHSASTGTLTIEDVTVANGYYFDDTFVAPGGCIYSGGSVVLSRVTVTGCEAVGIYSNGGGIYALGDVVLTDSTVSGNRSIGNAFKYDDTTQQDEPQPGGQGGGAYAVGALTVARSTVSGNEALLENGAPAYNRGGGLFALGPVTVVESAISGNVVTGTTGHGGLGGGVFSNVEDAALTITNSTISGNQADMAGGVLSLGALDIASSTIAFNHARTGLASGVWDLHDGTASASMLNGTILANNADPANPGDADFHSYSLTIQGAANLVITTSATTMPPDTLTADPLLLPLADNGGPTQTHALASGSPAIDAGNNAKSLPFDQRGLPFVREANGQADIGAFEVQDSSDTIFENGFDG